MANQTIQNPDASRCANGSKDTMLVFVVSCVCASGLVLLGTCVLLSDRGINFSDEGYYLNSIAHPLKFGSQVTNFGLIYFPLFSGVGENLWLLRSVSIGILYALSTALFWLTFRDRVKSWLAGTVSLALSVTVLIHLHYWLPTPNYNSLCLAGLLIVAIGVFLCFDHAGRKTDLALGLWMGLGAWLIFMGKPTSAAATGLVVSLCLFASQRLTTRLVAITAAAFFLLLGITALILSGSVSAFWRDVAFSLGGTQLLDGYKWSEIINIGAPSLKGPAPYAGFILGAISVVIVFSKIRFVYAGTGTIVAIISVILTILVSFFVPRYFLTEDHNSGLIALAILPVFIVAIINSGQQGELSATNTVRFWSVFGLLLIMPFLYAFGTNNFIWRQINGASIFWFVAAVHLTSRGSNPQRYLSKLTLIASTGLLAASMTLAKSMERPLGQSQSLFAMTDKVEIRGTELKLSSDAADYLEQLKDVSLRGNFEPGTPVIDMTGKYPASLFVMGANPIGSAWMIGGHSGSDRFAYRSLRTVSCEKLSQAWVLLEPDSLQALNNSLFALLGLPGLQGYEPIGSLRSPLAVVKGGKRRRAQQTLMKPLNPSSGFSGCMAIRDY